MEVLIQKRH